MPYSETQIVQNLVVCEIRIRKNYNTRKKTSNDSFATTEVSTKIATFLDSVEMVSWGKFVLTYNIVCQFLITITRY